MVIEESITLRVILFVTPPYGINEEISLGIILRVTPPPGITVVPAAASFGLDSIAPTVAIAFKGLVVIEHPAAFALSSKIGSIIVGGVYVGILKVWDGSQWVHFHLKTYAGGVWEDKPVRIYNSEWQEVDA